MKNYKFYSTFNEKMKLYRGSFFKRKVKEPSYVKRNEKVRVISKKLEEDLYKNHNHSWYDELRERNKNNLSKVALFYRGTEITYQEMFDNMEKYALCLKASGYKKGSRIPVCMGNCPEYVYLLGAASIIGATMNVFGAGFDPEKIEEIVSNTDQLFMTDDMYEIIDKKAIEGKKKVIFSLNDSLPNHVDPYYEFDKDFYDFSNKVPTIKKTDSKVMDKNEFEMLSNSYCGEIFEDVSLDDVFSITYSSGSTNKPKPITHTVKSYVAMGRWHDTDISKSPNMSWMTVLDHIYPHSNTGTICSLSDGLLQTCTVALEPIFKPEFLIYSLYINKANYVIESRSFWMDAFKDYVRNKDTKYKGIYTKDLLVPFSVGEPYSRGEEKFGNKVLRMLKAGTNIIKTPFSPITMSVAGGDNEHGGIFFILFRALRNKLPYQIGKNVPHGMGSYETVEYAVLNEKGEYCANDEVGDLVANSTCTMKEYDGNPEATQNFFVTDAYGHVWGKCNVKASIDIHNFIQMKPRSQKTNELPDTYIISDIIDRDTKNVLSCETFIKKIDDKDYYVVYLEPQLDTTKKLEDILMSAKMRCQKALGNDISDRLLFVPCDDYYHNRIHPSEAGKRDLLGLNAEDINESCVVPVDDDYGTKFITASGYHKMTRGKVYQK